ncbi:MAG: hypothetical protein WCL49_13460, partial [bacterium]
MRLEEVSKRENQVFPIDPPELYLVFAQGRMELSVIQFITIQGQQGGSRHTVFRDMKIFEMAKQFLFCKSVGLIGGSH